MPICKEEEERPRPCFQDPLAEIRWSLQRVHAILEACDAWLRNPQTGEYDVSPRSEELWVRYREHDPATGAMQTRRATLQQLLNRLNGTSAEVTSIETVKAEDPRRLLLRAAQELRQTLKTGVELARTLTDVVALQRFQEALLEEIRAVDAQTARRIVQRIHHHLLSTTTEEPACPMASSPEGALSRGVCGGDVPVEAGPVAEGAVQAAGAPKRRGGRKSAGARPASGG